MSWGSQGGTPPATRPGQDFVKLVFNESGTGDDAWNTEATVRPSPGIGNGAAVVAAHLSFYDGVAPASVSYDTIDPNICQDISISIK